MQVDPFFRMRAPNLAHAYELVFLPNWFFLQRQDNDTAKGLNTLLFAGPVGNKYEIRGCRGIAPYDSIRRSLSALPTTLTEDNAMAAAAITGERRMPNAG